MKTVYCRKAILAVCFLCLAAARFCNIGWVVSLTTFLWLTLFCFYIDTAKNKKELIAAAIIFIAGYTIRNWGFTGLFFTDLVLLAVTGFVIFCVFYLSDKLCRGRTGIKYTLYFPVFWMTVFAVYTVLRVPSALRIDIWFYGFPTLMQCEALFSSYGLSFLILWCASLVAYTLQHGKLSGVITAAICFALMISFGTIRVGRSHTADGSVKVAYTTGPYKGDFINFTNLEYSVKADSAIASVNKAKEAGADILVFCEEAFEVTHEEEAQLLSLLCEEAKKNKLYILAALDCCDDAYDKNTNKLVLIDADGNIAGDYVKKYVVPFVESDYTGSREKSPPSYVIRAGDRDVKISFAICYDSNFPFYFSRMDEDTSLLFLPSWDWASITESHSRICGCLSAEYGVSVLKATYDGISVCADPYGNVLQKTNTDVDGFETVHTVDMPIYSIRTHSSVICRWIVQAFPLIFVFIAVNELYERRRKK